MSAVLKKKERAIIFNAESVRAIRARKKFMTRRVIKPQPIEVHGAQKNQFCWYKNEKLKNPTKAVWLDLIQHPESMLQFCPYGQPGDELWVKEAAFISPENFSYTSTHPGGRIVQYYATEPDREGPESYGVHCRPAFLMPRWASRLLLRVTALRVERLNSISEADAMAEGVRCETNINQLSKYGFDKLPRTEWASTAREAFIKAWDLINSKRGYSSTINPWVWVVNFEVIACGS